VGECFPGSFRTKGSEMVVVVVVVVVVVMPEMSLMSSDCSMLHFGLVVQIAAIRR